jgi:GDP-L-fucose synthase
MNWNNKKVLVTGGAGQIGSNLVVLLVEKGADVSVVDNLWRGQKSNLYKEGKPVIDMDNKFHELDLINYENCLKVVSGQDVIYHLADVVAGINYVFGHQFSLFNTNLLIDSNMLKASVASQIPDYIYVGTACSYPADKQSELNPPLFKETDVYPALPESSYGWSKLMGEYACELVQKEKLMNIGLLRFHNVYGPRCVMDPEKSQVIPSLIRKAINFPNEEFIVWGSGKQRRAFVFVNDIITALESVADKGMNQGAIQIGPDFSTSISEIAQAVVGVSGKKIPIEFDRTKPEGDMDRAADWTKAKEVLGWSPTVGIEQGIEMTYEWCSNYLSS